MADATLGSRNTQASANCAGVQPASSASGLSVWTASRMEGASHDCMEKPMLSLLARESPGRLAPGRYLPLSTPCPSGDHTIWEMPLAAHSGITSLSGLRHSSEYCGWLETKRSLPATAKAPSIWCDDHSLKSIQRALPWRTTSLSACIVSSIGVAES